MGGITGETQYVRGLRSFREIILRPGDFRDEFSSGRGDVARRKLCDAFMQATEYDALLMCDLDMWHPPDMLEKLRSHDKDMVTGHYFAREAHPVHSIIGQYGDGKWPFLPLNDIPTTGLHRVGMTGMGNVLIKRHVIEAVAKYLPPGDEPFAIGPCPAITGDYRSLGSDYRFFPLAQRLGFELWLDASVESQHAVTFWIGRQMYEAVKPYQAKETFKRNIAYIALQLGEKGMNPQALQERIKQIEGRKADLVAQKASALKTVEFLERQITGLNWTLNEDKWLLENLPKLTAEFPTVPEGKRGKLLANRLGVEGMTEQQVKQAREGVAQKEAREFAEDLDGRPH